MYFQRFSVVVASSEPVDEEQLQEVLNGRQDILAEVSCVSVGRIFAAAEEAEETEEAEDTEETEDTGETEDTEDTEETEDAEETEELEVENGAGGDPIRRAIGDRRYADFAELRQRMLDADVTAAAVCRRTGLHSPDWSAAKRVGKLFPYMKAHLAQHLGISIDED